MTKERLEIRRIDGGESRLCTDESAVESSFLVKAGARETFRVTCTPEHLEELVLGQLFLRGLITCAGQAERVEILEGQEAEGRIIVTLLEEQAGTCGSVGEDKDGSGLEAGCAEDGFLRAGFSGAGLSEQEFFGEFCAEKLFPLAEEVFLNPGELFADTGCAHCCALYYEGRVVCRREDIGRHNALDKVIGYGLKAGIDFTRAAVFTTGRVSGDYMEKIRKSGIAAVVSRAAVTDAAVMAARREKKFLYGFVRKGRGNQYAPG